MSTLSEFPYFEVQFTKAGEVHDDAEVEALRTFLQTEAETEPVTDLFVISHGWNNDMEEARGLYAKLFKNVRAGLTAEWVPGVGRRKLAIMAVLWPSKKIADKELIPSGAASAGSIVSTTVLRKQLDDLKTLFDDPTADEKIDQAKGLIAKLERSPAARKEFADLVRSLLPADGPDEEAPAAFRTLDGDELLERLARPVVAEDDEPVPEFGTGGAAAIGPTTFEEQGGAAGLFEPFIEGVKAGARRLINFATYYEMKERAGTVGSTGVNAILRRLRQDHPNLKLHLIGHSFGARLVTSAVAGAKPEEAVRVQSLSLLQAAFSHHGFAQKYDKKHDGFFRRVVADGLVAGPIAISHTVHDKPVGLAYPIASLIAGQTAARLGDKDDPYGGLGRNGAQKTPEAKEGTLLAIGGTYEFAAGSVYNLNGDAIIGGHGDVEGEEVAFALLTAVAAS